MKLYFSPGACSLAARILLEEAGIPYSAEAVDLKTKKTSSGDDFMAINPRGYVPALLLGDGATLSEAVAILAYIADQAPGNAFPQVRQGMGRYDMLSWLAFISSELHKNFGAFFNPAASSDSKDAATASLKARLSYLDRHLDGRDFLMGEAFGPPDAYLFVVLSWARYVRLDLTDWRNVTAYLSRVGGRPGVQQALKAEGLA